MLLTLAGDAEGAEAKLAEAEEAANAPASMTDRQRAIHARIEEIDSERKAGRQAHLRYVVYADVQSVVRAAERGLFCTLLDGLKASFYEYQERTGTGGTVDRPYSFLVKDSHLSNLTAHERSAEWNSGQRWYSGRTR